MTYITWPYTIDQGRHHLRWGGVRYVQFTGAALIIRPGNWFSTCNVTATYRRQYLVSVISPLPVVINETTSTNYAAWLSPGPVIRIMASDVVLGINNMFKPSISDELATVNSPLAIDIRRVHNT